MLCEALVGLDRTRTYRSDRSRWGTSHTDKRMRDHADLADLSGRRDPDRASYTNPNGLICVQEPSRKHPIKIILVTAGNEYARSCTSSRWRSVEGSRSSKARVLLCVSHVLVRTFYHITWVVLPDGKTYRLPKHTCPSSFNLADFVTLSSPWTAEIKNLRAFFIQEKSDHAGNRTHAYHAQKRMWFAQQASIMLRMCYMLAYIFPTWILERLWLWTWSLGNRQLVIWTPYMLIGDCRHLWLPPFHHICPLHKSPLVAAVVKSGCRRCCSPSWPSS